MRKRAEGSYSLVTVHAKTLDLHDTGFIIALHQIARLLELGFRRILIGVGRHCVRKDVQEEPGSEKSDRMTGRVDSRYSLYTM